MNMPENDVKVENIVDASWKVVERLRSIKELASGLDKVLTNVQTDNPLKFFKAKSTWEITETVLISIVKIANECFEEVRKVKKLLERWEK